MDQSPTPLSNDSLSVLDKKNCNEEDVQVNIIDGKTYKPIALSCYWIQWNLKSLNNEVLSITNDNYSPAWQKLQ